MSATREVISYAKENGGVFTTHEAVALGLPASTLDRRVSDGIFVRIGRGVLALPGTSTRPDALLRAAGRILGAVVSHESAAKIHELGPIRTSRPSVTVAHRGTHSFPGVTVHQSTDLLSEHLVAVGVHTVTSPARTIIDLAKVTGRQRLERIVEMSLASRTVRMEDLASLFAALRRPGKPGMKNLGEILDERSGDNLAYSESELELILFRTIVDAELPPPVKQFRAPWLRRGRGRVDLAYVDRRIVIEGDSRRWHGLFDAFETDRRRDNAAALAGWTVLRFGWRTITEEPYVVISDVRAALGMREAGFTGES